MGYVNLRAMAQEAFEHIGKSEFAPAEKKLSYVLNTNPDNALLYYYLGYYYSARKQHAMAAMAYEKAITLDKNFDEALCNLGGTYRQLGLMETARTCFERAVKVARHPQYLDKCEGDKTKVATALADYLGNLGSSYIAGGTSQQALDILNESLKVLTRPNTMWNWGLANLELGNYVDGFNGYDYGDSRMGDDKVRSYHGTAKSTPVWEGPRLITETNPKPTVVVYGEQGIGDEIMFASIIPDLVNDANVILDCHPRLMDLFRQSFPDVTVFGTRKATMVTWAKNFQIDAQIAIGSLAKHYRKAVSDFPGESYLRPNARLSDQMQAKLAALGDRPKIGLSWKGGIGVTNKSPRCIPLEVLAPLFGFDADFISLQYHSNARAEIDVFSESTGHEIIHWQDVVDDYDKTAALLLHLDLIISVPQSIIHLAGSLGIKTWQLCPVRALWQMGVYGCDMPWYKTVTNIWQESDGNWEPVIDATVLKLEIEGFKKC